MLQKRAVDAAAEVLLELHDSYAAIGAIVCKPEKTAAFAFFDRHLGDYGDACAGSHHRQDGGELSALKHHIRLQAGASAGRQGIFPKAVAFLEQKKRIVLDLLEVNAGQRRQPVILRNDGVEPFAKKFVELF